MMRPEHHFSPDLADRYGVDVAIILHEIAYYVDYNRRNGVNFHEGRWWMFNTLKSFCESHTYWTKNQVEYLLRKCRDKGLILTGHFHEGGNRTTWYTLSDEIAAFFGDSPGPATISENSEMDTTHFGNFRQPFRKFQKSNNNEENNIQENNIHTPKAPQGGRRGREVKSAPDWKPERFAKFWDFYSHKVRGESKQAAIRAWDKLRPDDALIDQIGKALLVQIESPAWKEGYGIPYAATYLNNQRWTDIPQTAKGYTAQPSSGWAEDKEVL